MTDRGRAEPWRTFGAGLDQEQRAARYARLYSFWAGQWSVQSDAIRRQSAIEPTLYVNTRQLWRHADAIVSLYESLVYAGDLSTDGGPLKDGTLGAIPLDLQTGGDATDEQLQIAIAELWNVWKWRQAKGYRPKLGAIFGDCLTELVDDLATGFVFPRTMTSDVVTDLELNYVGDIKRYAVEWWVPAEHRTIYGKPVRRDGFHFRKEVDGKNFRYFKDGKPSPIMEWGIPNAIEPNVYGFVPAVWDRHDVVPGDRGMSAIERTLSQALEMNSILSHALDYQRRQFSAPVGVVGGNPAAGSITRAPAAGPSSPFDVSVLARSAAQSMDVFPMSTDGKFVTVEFDPGKTVETLQVLMDSILAEAPESRYGQQILEMTQVTAPGVERAMGPIFSRVERARDNYDPQTVKIQQMAVAMIGFRLKTNRYPPEVVSARANRYKVFAPFDLDSFNRGLLDHGIQKRPILAESVDERVDRLIKIEQLQSRWAMLQAGVPEEEADAILGEREKLRLEMAEQVTGIDEQETDEEAPTNGEAAGA